MILLLLLLLLRKHCKHSLPVPGERLHYPACAKVRGSEHGAPRNWKMFYSHSLLSRKGALGTIWVAAHCFKKLKRDQIDHTDISSSVDKIMPEIQISYRILAHLLLGIVRIFSKKVDYLYRDCNEALTCIRKSFTHVRGSRTKGAVIRGHDQSIEAKGHTKAHRIGLSEDPFFTVPVETMCDPYHYVTISVPKRLELDSFDLDVPDDEDVAGNRPYEQSTSQDHLLDDHNDPYFQNECNHRESAVLYEMSSLCFTPVKDVLPPCMIDLEFHGEYNLRSGEEKEDNPQGDIRSHRRPGLKKSLAPILTNGESESVQIMITVDSVEDVNNLEKSVEPLVSCERFLSNDKFLPACTSEDAIPTQPMETKSSSPILTNGESEEQLHPVQMMKTVDSDTAEDIGNLEKSVEPSVSHKTFSSNDKNVPARTSQDAIATDPTKSCQEDLLPCELGVPSPKFTVRTPAKKEYRPMLKKRKKNHFDKIIVLSNETLRKGVHDASSLVFKRRKVPHTYLDVWKFNRISNLDRNFAEPLTACMASELKVLFQSINSFSRPPDVPVDQHLKSADAENKICTSSKGNRMCITSSEFTDSCNETVVEVLPPKDTGVPRTDNFSVMETETVSSLEPSDAGLNFMDQELESVGNHAIGQDNGWSLRTRYVAQYLCSKFLHHKGEKQKASFSLQEIVQGNRRPDCARLFYEILILKGHQCIDVDQESPCGEISISPTPKLVAEFSR